MPLHPPQRPVAMAGGRAATDATLQGRRVPESRTPAKVAAIHRAATGAIGPIAVAAVATGMTAAGASASIGMDVAIGGIEGEGAAEVADLVVVVVATVVAAVAL